MYFLKHLHSYSLFFIIIWTVCLRTWLGADMKKRYYFCKSYSLLWVKNPPGIFCLNFIDISNYSCSSEVLFKLANPSSFIHHESNLSLVFSAPSGINRLFFPGVTNLTLLFRLCTCPLFYLYHSQATLVLICFLLLSHFGTLTSLQHLRIFLVKS